MKNDKEKNENGGEGGEDKQEELAAIDHGGRKAETSAGATQT